MKIISWNINGLRASIKKGLFEWVDQENPDIVGFQEIKATPKQAKDKIPDMKHDYQFDWNPAEKKGYSGVLLLSKKDYTAQTIKIDIFGEERLNQEGRIIQANYDDFILFNVYFPNGKRSQERLMYKLDFYDYFLAYIEELRMEGSNIIFMGDINTAHQEIDLARPKANENISGFLPIERQWIDQVIDTGYVDVFRHFNPEESELPEKRHYTWWSYRARGARERNVGWRLDYFFVNEEFLPKVKNVTILDDVKGSDHAPILLELDI